MDDDDDDDDDNDGRDDSDRNSSVMIVYGANQTFDFIFSFACAVSDKIYYGLFELYS